MNELFVTSIERSLLLSLSWINEQLPQFSLARESEITDPKEDVAMLKPISELSLTLCVLRRCGISLPVLTGMAEWAWAQGEMGNYLTRLLLNRADFLPSCTYYASLYQLGFRSEPLHIVVEGLAGSDMGKMLPLQPWAGLALDYNLDKLGLRDFNEKARRGLYLSHCPEPWIMPGEIGYAVTHEVFYLTDFGNEPLDDQLLLDYLKTWTPYWADQFISAEDFDLAGEFAMVWSCIENNPGSFIENLMSVLMAAQLKNGSVKGPEGAGGFLHRRDDMPERRSFLGHYHTTLVFTMAAALLLRNYHRK